MISHLLPKLIAPYLITCISSPDSGRSGVEELGGLNSFLYVLTEETLYIDKKLKIILLCALTKCMYT